jgi:hypothetical protein
VVNNGHWHKITGNVGLIGHDGSTLIEGFRTSTWIYQNGNTHEVNTTRAYGFA